MWAINMVLANQCGSVIKSITHAYPPAHGSEKLQILEGRKPQNQHGLTCFLYWNWCRNYPGI